MSTEYIDNDGDIEMIDSTNTSYTDRFLQKKKKYKKKRNYNKMISQYKNEELIKRKEQYQLLIEYRKRMEEKFKNQTVTPGGKDQEETPRGKTLIYQERVYDEEKERKFVENYYKIKNAELMKAVFGS